jgi:hypothetical protein
MQQENKPMVLGNEQLDEIYHNIDAWKTRIQSIKDNNPKG